MSEQLHGTIERVTYHSEETGYSVIRLNVEGRSGLVTVVGNLPEVNPGESLRLEGVWTTHPQYGRQFKVERCEQILPATVEGIKRYLGSGLVKGVGPVTAARIVRRFGTATLRVLDEEPRRLREALGVGPKRAAAIAKAWEEQRHIREVMLFLQSHGVTTGLAVKIYKTYGDDALGVVREDPYRLARDIWGVGFKTADKIARDLGLPPDAPSRVQAGVAHVLGQLVNEGHVYAPEGKLMAEAVRLLAVSPDLVGTAIEDLDAGEVVRRETLIYPPPLSSPPMGGKEGGEALVSVEAQVLRLSRLTADLRKLAELETRSLERAPVDIAELLQEAVVLAQEQSESEGRQLTLTLPQAPWPVPGILGDWDLLFLATYNLLDNALKFTRPGDTVEVRASEDGTCVVIEVADTGPGIPKEEIARVWEELYRGQGARGVPGSGLGLALVRAIVERHGGQVTLRSRPGQGTVVTMRLPVQDVSER